MNIKKLSLLLLFPIINSCFNRTSSDTISQDFVDIMLLEQIKSKKVSKEKKLPSLGGDRFYIYNYEEKKLSLRDFDLVKTTQNYKIWVEEGIEDLTQKTIDDYAEQLETKMHPVLIRNFGGYKDIDKDGRIHIMISNSINKGNSNGVVAGYVNPTDYTDGSGSNKGDLVYINYRLFSSNMQGVYKTTAHELQHLFRLSFMDLSDIDSLWINEGSSDYMASEVYGPLDDRVNCFNGSLRNGSGCQQGANNTSVFDRTGTIGLYSFRYAFMTYLFHTSSNTDTEREDFFYKSVTGKDRNGNTAPARAKNATKLFQSFKYAQRYDSNLLSSDSNEIFYKLYSNFLLQSTSFSVQSGVIRNLSQSVKKGTKGAKEIDFTNIISNYPLPSFFQQKTGNTNALKLRLLSYNQKYTNGSRIFKSDDDNRSANNSYFAVRNSDNKVFDPKDDILSFSLKKQLLPLKDGRRLDFDIFLRINTSIQVQGSKIRPSLLSLNESLFEFREEHSDRNPLHFNLSEADEINYPVDSHFGCVYPELHKEFISEMNQNQYQILSD